MDKRLTLLIPVTFGMAFFLGVENGGFQLVLLKIAEEFVLDPVKMGGVVTSQFCAILLGPLLFGWISDRIGKKTVLIFGMIFFIAGCFGAAISKSALIFTCTAFFLGLGFSVCECTASTLLTDSFPGKESTYLNIMQSGFSLGAVLSPLIFSRLIWAGLVTWHAVFISAGAGFIIIFPLLMLSRSSVPLPENEDAKKKVMPSGIKGIKPCFDIARSVMAEQVQSQPSLRSSIKTEIFSPFFIILLLAIMVNVAIEAGIGFFADTLFVTEYGNAQLGAYAISGFWFSMAVSRFVFSWIKIKPLNMVTAGFLSICVLLLFSLPLGNPNILLAVFFLLGFASGPIWPMIIGIGASLNQKRSGTNTSILYASGGLGGIIMPVLIGLVAERHGFYRSFWLLAVFSAAGFLIMRFGARRRIT